MSKFGHSLVPKRGAQVQKIANIGVFAPKPYLKGIDPDFLFDSKFSLVEILKRWKGLGVYRNEFFTTLKNMKITKAVRNGLNIANDKANL